MLSQILRVSASYANAAHIECRCRSPSHNLPVGGRYGQHLSNQQVHDLIAPTPDTLRTVLEWLASHGIIPQAMTSNSDWLTATMPISLAEQLLDAEYYALTHAATNTTAHRVLRYSVPQNVAASLDLVAPTLHLPVVAKPSANQQAIEEPLFGNGPKHLRELYSVDVEGAAPSNRMVRLCDSLVNCACDECIWCSSCVCVAHELCLQGCHSLHRSEVQQGV